MSPLHVLHVIDSMIQGGAESLILEHVRHASSGTTSTVCALNRGGPALEAAGALGARVELLGKGARRLDGIRRLGALMRERRIDVVNGHNPTGAVYATLAGAWAGVPVIVRTEHSIHYPGRHSLAYTAAIEPLITWRARGVICVCEAVRQSHVRRLAWAASRFVTIDNGISAAAPARSRDEVRRELQLGGGPVALTVGSLTPQKAQHVLIDAFARLVSELPDATLLIAGGGALESELREHAASRGVEARVRFLGPRQDVADLLQAADVFVLSSVREGLSVTLLEAMRAGRPVVATRVGGTADVVDDGVTGRVVPPGQAAPLGDALAGVLGDPARAAAMAAAGRARWEARYRAERMVETTESLYRRLLGGGAAIDRGAAAGAGEPGRRADREDTTPAAARSAAGA